LIELLNGEKIGITPEQQVQFIDEVRAKASKALHRDKGSSRIISP